ncbi:uncharacterized protein LOC121397685 [Xenopus laevis]|uniref:Uncharacterized protein LOC121397685 n=1 Tax=Xenopus laevis TaxID=8355 RepID=A0A8J1LMK6_XENLA|nr:uncharacterized protein LOC121397685 [Xenopus laevis]XP_041430808.1 uncharacterized protein LOC121397685 [Xenopus laevis]
MTTEANVSVASQSASTFAYSESEITKILEGIEDLQFSQNTAPPDDVTKELYFQQKKELSLNLHLMSLAQYVKARRIPRGLRVPIQPNLCAEDPVLIRRWQEICNKCSRDLMTLTIERLHEKVSVIRKNVSVLKDKVVSSKGAEQAEAILREQAETLQKQRDAITARKAAKFERDALDYQQDRVYSWREENRRQRGRLRTSGWRQHRYTYQGNRGDVSTSRDHSTDSSVTSLSQVHDRYSSEDSTASSSHFLEQERLGKSGAKKHKKQDSKAATYRERYPSRNKQR